MPASRWPRADPLPPLRDVVRAHGLLAKKSLGQNFLFDLNLTGRIARAAGPLEDATIIEVGPGPGGLTRALLAEGARKVIAIERDDAMPRCTWRDRRSLSGPTDDRCRRRARHRLRRTGSRARARWSGAHLRQSALQYRHRAARPLDRERALAAVVRPAHPDVPARSGRAHRRDAGRSAPLTGGWRCFAHGEQQARILFDVPARAFTPPPKINSSVVELVPRRDPLPCDARALSAVTQAAFGQRRKMLRQSLRSLPHADANALLEAAGIDPTQRAEEIEVEGFVEACAGLCSSRLRGLPDSHGINECAPKRIDSRHFECIGNRVGQGSVPPPSRQSSGRRTMIENIRLRRRLWRHSC